MGAFANLQHEIPFSPDGTSTCFSEEPYEAEAERKAYENSSKYAQDQARYREERRKHEEEAAAMRKEARRQAAARR